MPAANQRETAEAIELVGRPAVRPSQPDDDGQPPLNQNSEDGHRELEQAAIATPIARPLRTALRTPALNIVTGTANPSPTLTFATPEMPPRDATPFSLDAGTPTVSISAPSSVRSPRLGPSAPFGGRSGTRRRRDRESTGGSRDRHGEKGSKDKDKHGGRSPGGANRGSNPTHSGAPPTPILAISPVLPPTAPGVHNDMIILDQPEFAELLTPAQLRRRRRRQDGRRTHRTQEITTPDNSEASDTDAAAPSGGVVGRPGLNAWGYTTGDGDLYRGATNDPNRPAGATDATAAGDDNDDVTTISSEGSTSSSWSWGSGNLGRTMDALQRIGEVIGVRRGSTSSSSSDSTGSGSDSDGDGSRSVFSRFGRLSRTRSRGSDATERPKRVYVPRRREFTLLLPAGPGGDDEELAVTDGMNGNVQPLASKLKEDPLSSTPMGSQPNLASSDRVLTTPVLQPVLEAIRMSRLASGMAGLANDPVSTEETHHQHRHHRHHHHRRKDQRDRSDIPVRRGGSAPGRARNARAPEFSAPPIPRPGLNQRTQTLSRVEQLRASARTEPVRPKSASDLLGLSLSSASVTPSRSGSASSVTDGVVAAMPLPPTFSLDDSIPTEPPQVLGIESIELDQSPPIQRSPSSPTPTLKEEPPKPRAAWWLDVSCPSWKDLRDIGELLGIHPLTLEDVLQQDPREKLDIYSKLGYYFAVVRALDEQYFKYTPGTSRSPPVVDVVQEKSGAGLLNAIVLKGQTNTVPTGGVSNAKNAKQERTRRGWGFGRATGRAARKEGEKVEIVEDRPGKEGLEGVGVGGVNLYLVVFADGIVSFHFDDVSKHTTRVRERALSAPSNQATSDWITHGLLDSIVDAFFPLTAYLDGAVDDIDALTIDPTHDPRAAEHAQQDNAGPSPNDMPYEQHDEDGVWIQMEEKVKDNAKGLRRRRQSLGAVKAATEAAASSAGRVIKDVARGRPKQRDDLSRPPPSHLELLLTYIKLFCLPTTDGRGDGQLVYDGEDVIERGTMLRSIHNMRRLVTGLSRLLVGKQTVVASMLKRASDTDAEVAAYLSDVHDHILLLQTSLFHYEYILSACQPAYMRYLGVMNTGSKGGRDSLILALSVITVGVLPMQLVLGMFSMNVNRPTNGSMDVLDCSEAGDPTNPGCPTYEGHKVRADGTPAPFNYFICICISAVVILACVATIVRSWRWRARKKFGALRGKEVPGNWDGYWGWK